MGRPPGHQNAGIKSKPLPRYPESVGEGHPDKIADQVSNAFSRPLLLSRYVGDNVMSPGQVAQFERIAKECQYQRKYRKPHTTAFEVGLEQAGHEARCENGSNIRTSERRDRKKA
ncbi:hypothetical protein CaCOL14_013178 [Colletotrichum acutatum]